MKRLALISTIIGLIEIQHSVPLCIDPALFDLTVCSARDCD